MSLRSVGDSSTMSPTKSSRRIEDAALELFYRKGYVATTVREIMEACGQTPGALYNHFPSKDTLLFSIIRGGHDELDSMLQDALARAGHDPTRQLWESARAFTIWHTKFQRAALVANTEYRRLSTVRRNEIVTVRRRVRSLFVGIIDRGHGDGVFEIPPVGDTIDTKLVAMALLETLIRLAEWFRREGELTADDVADLHADLALTMVSSTRH